MAEYEYEDHHSDWLGMRLRSSTTMGSLLMCLMNWLTLMSDFFSDSTDSWILCGYITSSLPR